MKTNTDTQQAIPYAITFFPLSTWRGSQFVCYILTSCDLMLILIVDALHQQCIKFVFPMGFLLV